MSVIASSDVLTPKPSGTARAFNAAAMGESPRITSWGVCSPDSRYMSYVPRRYLHVVTRRRANITDKCVGLQPRDELVHLPDGTACGQHLYLAGLFEHAVLYALSARIWGLLLARRPFEM
ncbi:MAG: hypothetical protein NVSMB2_20320 [Chloroflexota bacterium]